jgi:hypothetical protein
VRPLKGLAAFAWYFCCVDIAFQFAKHVYRCNLWPWELAFLSGSADSDDEANS